MAEDYSVAQCRRLHGIVEEAALHHKHGPSRYDAGHVFDLAITGVCPAVEGRATVEVEKFIGGGFAGQVYQVTLQKLDVPGEGIPGLVEGHQYAIKIIIPPSRFSLLFRNTIFALAYQGPFAPQVNPSAARAGVLWQKLIRGGAKVRFGREEAVADTYATFFDEGLGSFGEINEWIEGRIWKFETDDHIIGRRKRPVEEETASREYLAKRAFMRELVRLFHDMGAPELARQYEWWTAKSQPNVLKRTDSCEGAADEDPYEGLTALDFRAGLALLPFLPMSPGDVPLIFKGLARGALVQFDRGNLEKLEAFCGDHGEAFQDLESAVDELKQVDPEYRASLPDVAHHGLHPLYDGALRKSIRCGFVQGWQVRGAVDDAHGERLKGSFLGFWLFLLLGCVPVLGTYVRRYWGRSDFRRHVHAFFTSFGYMRRAFRARQAETLIKWHRAGRVGEGGAEFFLGHPVMFWVLRLIPGFIPLPAKWHRFLTDPNFAGRSIKDAVMYPIRFYRDAAYRVEWLTDEIEAGAEEGMLTSEERERILDSVPDPFIQKYLKCVAVHIATLPLTQIVSVLVAFYVSTIYGESYEERALMTGGILALFQVMPISPGSIVRGLYVVYLIIKERDWHNYRVAAFISFWKYIGYFGFPIQMVRHFPALSRYMAGRWATRLVNHIPVFGERGALLEHAIFDLFFNLPLTIQRRLGRRRREVLLERPSDTEDGG